MYKNWAETAPPNAIFVEVGVWLGKSLCYMAELLKDDNRGIKLYGVDLWLGSSGEPLHDQFIEALRGCDRGLKDICTRNLEEAGVLDRVELLKDDSAGAAESFADQSLDFVFLDANHSYLSVKRDIAAWKPKIKKGGVLAGHDIVSWPSVREAVKDSFQNHERIGDVWIIRNVNA